MNKVLPRTIIVTQDYCVAPKHIRLGRDLHLAVEIARTVLYY